MRVRQVVEQNAAGSINPVKTTPIGQVVEFDTARALLSARLPVDGGILLQTIVLPEGKTTEGELIRAIALPWWEMFREIERDPDFLFQFTKYPRKFEEFIAAAYEMRGWEVVLTPRSGDGGVDVIATKLGLGSLRFLEQCKAYSPGRLVRYGEVSEMLGVLQSIPNATKGLLTTTSDFAPGVFTSPKIQQFVPYHLELKNGTQLIEWLKETPND